MLKRALSLCVALSVFAGMAAGQSGPAPSLSFIDRWGADAPKLAEYDLARIRLTDPSLDVSGQRDTVTVNVSSVLGPDLETVTLTETGKRTGVFEGGIDLRINGGSPAFPGILETMGPSGAFDSIQVDADGGLSDTAQVVPSILRLVDDQGDEVAAFAAGGSVFVRLIDRLSDTPNPDTTTVTLTTSGGDSEVVTLAETAVNGGEFRGSIASRLAPGTPTPGDGILDAVAGETLSASHEDVNNVTSSSDTAPFAGITLRFVDSRGVPTSTCLEGMRITLQAISAGANLDYLVVEEIPATLISQLGGDSESVALIETGTSTGVFEGRIRVTGYTPVAPGNTDIQVSPSLPVPETIEASAPGAAPVTIHPSGSSTRLLDVWGNDAETFPRGGTLRVRVEDHMIDSPYYSLQSTGVRLLSLTTGDEELLILDETGIGSNVYEGSLALEAGPAIPGDGKLQAQADGEILEARHDDWNGVTVSTDTGRLSPAEMWFLDDDGRPAETVLEYGTLRLRLFDSLQSTPPTADVTSEVAGDGENFYFSAVPGSPGAFEGSMPTEHMSWGTPTGNGILATRYDGNSLDGLDTIRAFALNTSASARAAFSELGFVDSHGNEAESFAIGETLHVRLRSWAFGAPGVDQVQILLLSQTTGDSETMTLTETGPETGVYQGSFPTGTGPASIADGRLQVRTGETIAAEDNRADQAIGFVLGTAVITAHRVTFVDRQNAPTDVVFRNGRARFEAFDLAANTDPGTIDSLSVTILSYREENGRLFDLETLDLVETGPDTALFRGSIRVSSNTAGTFGVLDTSFYSPYAGPDRLRVEILGGSSDRAELTDAIIRLLDGQSNDASLYQAGDMVRVRLIREASDLSPAIVDTAQVYLYSWIGRAATSQSYDALPLDLTETGPGTGVFEGEIEATAAPVDFTDSVFQVQPGGEIQAVIVGNWTEDADRALISDGGATPENYPPMAGDDSATVDELSSVEIDVLANDSDPNGDNLSIVSFTQGTKGSVTAFGAGLLYTPNAGLTGADSFTYTIEDPSGATDTATVWVTITEVNNPPVAVADNVTLNEDSPQGFLLLTNDYDPDGDTLTISAATNGSHGSTTRFSTSVFYQPAANWFGTDSFTYTVSDGKGGTAAGTVFVTVNSVNDVPVAGNNSAITNEDTPVTINVLANDSDVDGDTLTVTDAFNASKGTLTVNPNFTVTYTPNLNANGSDSFVYRVSDGKGGTATAVVTLTIVAVNDPPNAVSDSRTASEDTVVNIAILANDSDPEGQTLTVTAVTQGANGSVVLNADKTVTYTPNFGFVGTDLFTYTISDGILTATANVSVSMTPINDPPHAVDDEITLAEDESISFYVLSNDSDPEGETIYVASVLPATHGVVSRPGLNYVLTYTPKPNFHGEDFFVYTIRDMSFGQNSATVMITVTPVDDPPVAVNDAATVTEDSPATAVNVLANDTDVDGGPKSIDSVTQPANGTVVITGGGTGLTYQPNANDCNNPPGTTLDTFTYTLAPGGSTATVTMTVTCSDDTPTAVDDAATVNEDSGANPINVQANDTDIDGGSNTVSSVTQPANGTVVITNGGADLTYTPNANFCNTPETFTYTLAPGGTTATVTVAVTCVDDPPVALDDSPTVNEDSGANAIDVLANDTDPDGGPKSISAVTQPANGTVVITGGGTGLTYQPNANFCTEAMADTFTYTLSPGGSSTIVPVTVTCIDDPAVAVADAATVVEDSGASTINVQANDTDVDGGTNTISAVTQPANGTVAITNGGADLAYTPNANFCGTPDTFTYTLSPGGSTTTVTITVTCVDDSPAAVTDAATVAEDSGTNAINVLANDTDLDAGPISVAAVTQPANGTVAITNGGADLTYTPNANFCGALDTFNYSLSPGGSTAPVTITVTCINDAPVVDLDANDDQGTGGNDFAVTFTEGEAARLIEDPFDATVTDVDSATLASLTVTITNLLDLGSETLSADVTDTSITADYVSATGVLTLTGPDTLANFQTVLRKVTYLNTDEDSDATPRVIHFVANDGSADGNTAVSTVTVVLVDTPPTAVNNAATVNEDSGANAIDVLANDTDPDGGPISLSSVTQPANGTVAITGGGTGLTYQPNANFCGTPETFTYTLTPGGSTATVTVTVTCVDDNPVAVADAATVAEDSGANAIDVLANDTDVDGGAISISSVTQPANGTVVITGGGTGVTYQPDANFCGTPDTFTYTLTPGGSSTTVTVTVTCADDNPVAVADTATVAEDSGANAINVLANDTDVDGGAISISSVTQPANGTVVITGGGTGLTYQPDANFCGTPETFTYTLAPGGSTATVTVTVTCVDDNPVAVADAATVTEDSGANAIDVLANDTDVDGGAISISAVTQPANGTVVITGGGTGLTYQPDANFCNTPDTFTYTLAPGGSTATVTVTVTCVNDAPDAVNDVTATAEDTVVTVSVLANDTDVDGNPLQVTAVTQGTKGAVTINPNGTVTYTPALNTNGADAFTYTISDGNGGSDTATVTVSVAAVNDAPVAAADTATTREGAAVTVSVLANDSDVEGNTLTVTSATTPAGGTAAVNANNTVTYTPDANFNGTDSFTCTISDGQGGTATAAVTVTVTDALERVAVLATHGVWIQTGADVLSGDVIVNQTGAAPFLTGSVELSLAGTVTTPAGYDVQANRINVASGATVASDVFYNQLTGTVTGPQTSPLTLPVFATLPTFLTATPGTTDVNVGTNGTRTLAAGSYRDLIVGRKGTVTFTGGTYHFRTVQIDREAKLFFTAASTVRVQQKLTALQTTQIRPAAGASIDGSDIVIHVGGGNGTGGGLTETPKAVELGVDNVIWANVYAPNGTIWMKDRTQVRGVLLGKDVQLGPDVQVTLDSSFTGQ